MSRTLDVTHLKKFGNSKYFSILKTKNAKRLETYTKIYLEVIFNKM